MDTIMLLEELVKADGISGFESDASEFLEKKLASYCESTEIKKNGTVLGFLNKFSDNKKTVLLEAHLDRVGLCVSEIKEDGFVSFKAMGGVDERILPASEVWIKGKKPCFGIIGAVPPHLKSASDGDDTTRISDLLIDTGLTKEEAEECFSVGTPVLLASEFCVLQNGRVSSAALDNRAGIASIFECIELIKGKDLPFNVCIAFTVGEELGLLGAKTLIGENPPDLAVVIDVTQGRTLDSDSSGTFPLGSGVVICRGPNLHYEITKSIINLAKEKEIPFDIEVASGSTGTNAWVLQISGKGVPCALLSIPLRYMHTTVETVDTEDIKNTGKLLAEVLQGGVTIA